MPEYKKQHYLPIVYLSQFARPHDLGLEYEKRKIWRIGLTDTDCVPVRNQCQRDYFYSKGRAKFCETYFSKIESKYGSLVKSVISGQKLTKESMFLFFLCAVDFYARNFRFKVDGEEDEFEFYLKRIEIIKRKIISTDLSEASDKELRDNIFDRWDFKLIPFSLKVNILTSDCPSVWLGSQRNENKLMGVILPITPNYCFVAVHTEYYRIQPTVGSMDDFHSIEVKEIENSIHSVYYCDKPEDKQIDFIQNEMRERQEISQSIEGWRFELVDYDENPNLTFIDMA